MTQRINQERVVEIEVLQDTSDFLTNEANAAKSVINNCIILIVISFVLELLVAIRAHAQLKQPTTVHPIRSDFK
jgi:hypothetical protein